MVFCMFKMVIDTLLLCECEEKDITEEGGGGRVDKQYMTQSLTVTSQHCSKNSFDPG